MALEHIKQTMDQVMRDALTALGVSPVSAAPTNEDTFCQLGVQQMRFHVPSDFSNQSWTVTEHKACQGCANWHGVRYRGVLLVCAIHPAGVGGDWCDDWEKEEPQEPVE